MKSRTRARSLALQALYEIDLAEHPVDEVLKARLAEYALDAKTAAFAEDLVRGVEPLRAALDDYIAELAPEWPIDQVSIIDRNLLRIALWEFAVTKQTPVKVAINEAVELAKRYGSDSAPRFVNGVLGGLAERINEIHQAFKALAELSTGELSTGEEPGA
ncbi:MAG: transcription antitermination factor NusB [Chloroflexi bacterium]|nr:transcription antitermination factor NusB [Chloroflexota bacterium]